MKFFATFLENRPPPYSTYFMTCPLSEFLVQGAFVFLQQTGQKESTTEEEHPLV